MPIRVQFRHGTPQEWVDANPVLAPGEPGYELGTGKFKVGNGSNPWNNLPYSTGDPGPPGSQGVPGNTGSPGAKWFNGPDVPNVVPGSVNGDYFYHVSAQTVYHKVLGTWVYVGSITPIIAGGNRITISQAEPASPGLNDIWIKVT